MKIDSNLKVGIISSVIASCIFLVLLEPILRGITAVLFGFGAGLFRAYTDRLFAQAALLAPPESSFELLTMVVGFIVALGIGYTAGRISFWRRVSGAKRRPRPVDLEKLRRFPWPLLIMDVIAILALIGLTYSHLFQLRVISSFKQHMTAIAPYITDEQVKKLYSDWTQMRGEGDYRKIYTEISRIAAEHDIRLPENIVFSFRQI